MGKFQLITKGLIKENPTFVLLLGMCPTLATTTSAINGMSMGLATMFVLILSNIVISAIARFIPDKVRIPSYVVVIATFVTVVQMLMKAYLYDLYAALGVFLPLIVVNCIILGRAEMFASKNSVGKSALDGIGMGLGFTLALCAMAVIREVLGNATFAGMPIPFLESFKIAFLVKAPGGMLVYGLLIALVHVLTKGKAPAKKSFSCEGCPNAGNCHSAACSEKGAEN